MKATPVAADRAVQRPLIVRIPDPLKAYNLIDCGSLAARRSGFNPDLLERAEVALGLIPPEEADIIRHHFGLDEETAGLSAEEASVKARELFGDPDLVRYLLHTLVGTLPAQPLATAS